MVEQRGAGREGVVAACGSGASLGDPNVLAGDVDEALAAEGGERVAERAGGELVPGLKRQLAPGATVGVAGENGEECRGRAARNRDEPGGGLVGAARRAGTDPLRSDGDDGRGLGRRRGPLRCRDAFAGTVVNNGADLLGQVVSSSLEGGERRGRQ